MILPDLLLAILPSNGEAIPLNSNEVELNFHSLYSRFNESTSAMKCTKQEHVTPHKMYVPRKIIFHSTDYTFYRFRVVNHVLMIPA